MKREAYEKALDAAKAEALELRRQSREIQKRSAQLRQTINTLERLIADDSTLPPTITIGLTDAVREVLQASDVGLTPRQVRDGLIRMGIDPGGYTNLLASVHNILKRLVKSGEVDPGFPVDKKGKRIPGSKTVYRWSIFNGIKGWG